MSTIINATTTNGVVIQPDNSGSLVLQTNSGTTAVTISTAQDTTLAGKLTTASSGIQFSDASTQTAAASPYVLKNRIINGDFRIDQRNAGASIATTVDSAETYTLDRWYYRNLVASKYTIQQNAGSVTPPSGFTNYLGCTSTSAYTVAAGNFFTVGQYIEGFNASDLDFGKSTAKTITLSFWVRSSLTGTFGGVVANGGFSRCYPFSYTISTANTWTQISITIAGDTTGTWLTTTGIGLVVRFSLGAGSDWTATAGAWTSTAVVSATGATSVVGTNGATFYITGVQLEQNTTATPFERRMYGQELALCQRYFYKTFPQSVAPNFNLGTTNSIYVAVVSGYDGQQIHSINMRATPTITAYNPSGASGQSSSGSTLGTNRSSDSLISLQWGSVAGGTFTNITASSEL